MQYTIIAPGDDTLDLTIDEYHGRCNAIFVGTVPSAAQYAQLTAYSQRFQVCSGNYRTKYRTAVAFRNKTLLDYISSQRRLSFTVRVA